MISLWLSTLTLKTANAPELMMRIMVCGLSQLDAVPLMCA
jgi:hypothetical protein